MKNIKDFDLSGMIENEYNYDSELPKISLSCNK